jgi:hypothetical protein
VDLPAFEKIGKKWCTKTLFSIGESAGVQHQEIGYSLLTPLHWIWQIRRKIVVLPV